MGRILFCFLVLFSEILFATEYRFLGQHPSALKIMSSVLSESQPALDCRAHIYDVVCLVDPTAEGSSMQDRVCLEGSKAYAEHFQKIFDMYPALLQNTFCSVKIIFIEKQLPATAYADSYKNADGETIGAIMGIRQSVLDQNLSLTHWATWKEQLSFGGVSDSYTILPNLPHIQTATKATVNDFLYSVVTHEFGHILDFANGLNRTGSCQPKLFPLQYQECEIAKNTWGSISWVTTSAPLVQNEFSNRDGLCFYGCGENPLQENVITQVYASLSQTDFISLYASTNPWDDFAESLAYYMMDSRLNASYIIDTKQGTQYDMMWKLKSTRFSQKYDFIEKFLARDQSIVYP